MFPIEQVFTMSKGGGMLAQVSFCLLYVHLAVGEHLANSHVEQRKELATPPHNAVA